MALTAPAPIGLALAAALAAATVAAAGVGARVGDRLAGEAVYERCAACHSLARDRAGPRHCGLFGRRAGGVEGFPYSEALRRSAIVWDEATLDRFLADPMRAVPGTSMGYAGVPGAQERADLIAYLKWAGLSKECRS